MYAKKQINLHERSVAILELIKDANIRIEETRYDLKLYDRATNPFAVIRLMHNRRDFFEKIAKYEAVRDRLVCWYADVMQRLFEEAMFRIGKSKTVVELAEEALW